MKNICRIVIVAVSVQKILGMDQIADSLILESNDEAKFRISADAANLSYTVKGMAADMDDPTEYPIPFPNLSGEELKNMIDILENRAKNGGYKHDFSEDIGELFVLHEAANYMGVPDLTQLLEEKILAGKSSKDILKLINDFEPVRVGRFTFPMDYGTGETSDTFLKMHRCKNDASCVTLDLEGHDLSGEKAKMLQFLEFMPNVTYLTLKNCNLETIENIPDDTLKQLEVLNLQNNRLQQDVTLEGLPKLQFLRLNDNQLQNMSLQHLPELITLDLRNNQLQKVTLRYLPKLQILTTDKGNAKSADTIRLVVRRLNDDFRISQVIGASSELGSVLRGRDGLYHQASPEPELGGPSQPLNASLADFIGKVRMYVPLVLNFLSSEQIQNFFNAVQEKEQSGNWSQTISRLNDDSDIQQLHQAADLMGHRELANLLEEQLLNFLQDKSSQEIIRITSGFDYIPGSILHLAYIAVKYEDDATFRRIRECEEKNKNRWRFKCNKLDLSGNDLSGKRAEMLGYLERLPNVTQLLLKNCNLQTIRYIPEDTLERLMDLQLEDNYLQKVTLHNLPKLWNLQLGRSKLQKVTLQDLPNLQNLYIQSNQLQEVTLEHLPKLQVLTLRNNQLQKVTLQDLPKLERLWLSDNQLQKVTLEHLPKLEVLNLRNNQLQKVTLQDLPKVEYLWLNHNQLQKVSLQGLHNLWRLETDLGNANFRKTVRRKIEEINRRCAAVTFQRIFREMQGRKALQA